MYFFQFFFFLWGTCNKAIHCFHYADIYCSVPSPAPGQQESELSRWCRNCWKGIILWYTSEAVSCVQHGLSKYLELAHKALYVSQCYPTSSPVLVHICWYCVCTVYLPLCSGVISFWMRLANRWLWLLSNTNPTHRKLTVLKCQRTGKSIFKI